MFKNSRKRKKLRKCAQEIVFEITPPNDDEDFNTIDKLKTQAPSSREEEDDEEDDIPEEEPSPDDEKTNDELDGVTKESRSPKDGSTITKEDGTEEEKEPLQEQTAISLEKEDIPYIAPRPRAYTAGASISTEKFDTLSLSSLKRYTSVTSLVSNAMDRVNHAVIPIRKSEVIKLQIFVTVLFLLIVLFVGTAHVTHYRHVGEMRLFGRVKLEESLGRIFIFNAENALTVEAELGGQFTQGVHPYPCKNTQNTKKGSLSFNLTDSPLKNEELSPKKEDNICIEWKNQARLEMKKSLLKEGMNCYSLHWQSLHEDVSPIDCFPVGKDHGHWYGGGETAGAAWPLDKGQIRNSPFVTGDEDNTEWGNVIKKYFLNSKGFSLTIEDHTPLFVSMNESKFCIQARFDNFAYYYHRFNLPRLNYTICVEQDIKTVHSKLLPESFWEGHSQKDLDTLQHLLEKPIWQLNSKNEGFPVSHDLLEKYIEEVLGRRKFQNDNDRGYLLLDHRWQKYMGDFEFNNKAFPDIKKTLQIIKDSGFQLVLTVNPYVSTESKNFRVGVQKEIFVKERNSPKNVPALTWFDNIPSTAFLDITNNMTVQWLQTRLEKLSKTLNNEALFYLDIGNTFHVPTYFNFSVPLDNPDLYGEHFTKHVMDQVPVIGVSGASSKRPKAPAFVFLSTPKSNWSNLQTIIPKVLHLSVVDYPFVNPGPVGGVPSDPGILVQFELYVRWWQLNTFLPMLHFLQPPTLYPLTKISKVAKKLKSIRKDIVNPCLLTFSNGAMQTSLPVIRPLWMLNPNDSVALTIDDQFMIGDSILVAPVLEEGKRKRDIYLPTGSGKKAIWKSGFNGGNFFKGGRWLRDVEAKLEDVMFFIRQKNDTLPEL
ncbi:myogenesis-regulating glycosidase isoform X2 [Lepeophtheirus salmonis]|uniref:myogenesis-regulating glycosidase isoform X2 n=1 Tax=Lepeophtheirus salmonis TaxID=72036 RepID=UPI001AE7F4A7|nr:myogenesis-regulating glycosidase-like isoform X2 [Lepeophtheirus salmonis]